MTLSVGTIIEVEVPFTGGADATGATSKRRPVLVVCAPDALGDCVGLPVTGTGHHPNTRPIVDGQLAVGNMKKASFVRVRHPITFHRARAGKQYATLTDAAITAVRKDMCKALGC